MSLRLGAASPEYLAGALENPRLSRRELLLLLRNRQATPDLLRRIAGARDRMRYHEVRRAVALHPGTPLAVARSLVPHLYWKELAEVARSPQVNPVLRRQAEMRLVTQLGEMTEGERIALARLAGRAVIGALVESGSARELRGLLGNPRMTEPDAVRLASRASTPGEALARLATHERWGCRREVRLALLSNPGTPVPAALRLLRGMSRRDLQRLSENAAVPRIVRVGAARLIDPPGRKGATAVGSRQRHV